jgi:hypothetical protein
MDDTKVIEQDERCEWVAPTIKEWDVVSETQSAVPSGTFDGNTYS